MPEYLFQKKDTEETKLFFFSMNNVPSVGSEITDENGLIWKRIFTLPQASISTEIDPYSSKQFTNKLDGRNYTIGNLWDKSAELSEKRAEKEGGVDPVKQKFYDNYAKERHGQRHPKELKEKQTKELQKTEKQMKELGISVKLTK